MPERCQTRRSFPAGLITGSVLLAGIASAEVPATPTFTRDIAPMAPGTWRLRTTEFRS